VNGTHEKRLPSLPLLAPTYAQPPLPHQPAHITTTNKYKPYIHFKQLSQYLYYCLVGCLLLASSSSFFFSSSSSSSSSSTTSPSPSYPHLLLLFWNRPHYYFHISIIIIIIITSRAPSGTTLAVLCLTQRLVGVLSADRGCLHGQDLSHPTYT